MQEEINLSLETFSKNIQKEDVKNLAREIYESERVILLASHTTGNIAEIFQLFLLMARKFVEYYPQRHEQLSIISDLDENVLVLVFSIEGAYAQENEIMIPLMNSEARSILITQTSKSLYENEFDDIIELAPYVGLQSGKYKLLYFLEIVLHVYYDLYIKEHIQ